MMHCGLFFRTCVDKKLGTRKGIQVRVRWKRKRYDGVSKEGERGTVRTDVPHRVEGSGESLRCYVEREEATVSALTIMVRARNESHQQR